MKPLPRSLGHRLLVGLAILTMTCAPARAANLDALSENVLAELVWQQNPEVRQARLAEQQAVADVVRASRLSNPTLELSAGNTPLTGAVVNYPNDASNPPLPPGYGPQYSVGISQPYEWGKRGLRQQQAVLAQDAARIAALALHKERTADLLQVLVRLAASELKTEHLRQQLASVDDLMRITRLSAKEGMVAPLEAEKLSIEQGRLQTLLDSARLGTDEARMDWERLTLQPAPVLDAKEAEAVLARMNRLPEAWPGPDVLEGSVQRRQFGLAERQAQTALSLADRLRMPDVTVGLAYTTSRLPGDPQHAVSSTLSFGLPVFQAGQAERLEAESQLEGAKLARDHWRVRVLREEDALRRRAVTLTQMLARLQETRLAGARSTLSRLDRALAARGIPLSEVIQVRRAVLDMETERVEMLEQLGSTLVEYRRLLAWNLPDPEGVQP